jgi:hypothetical protein
MLLSKLTPGTAKPLMCPEEVLPTGPRSTTTSELPCLSLIPYLERATGKAYVSIGRIFSLDASLTISGGSLCLGQVLLLGTCNGKHELLPTPLRCAHGMFKP